ncbi:MAG: asparaginase [Opitutaceae bacterium]|nr:asparaginase [Opitutaceae bacterium]
MNSARFSGRKERLVSALCAADRLTASLLRSRMRGMNLRVLTTGGTIDKVYFDAASTYDVGDPQVDPVFRESNVTFEYVVEPVLRKDSLVMTDADRALIRERVVAAPERLILITHGTDTMTKTAESLKGIEDKVIVFTGSMVPARFRSSDAIFNLGCAVGAVQILPPGIYIAMNGRISPADSVQKNRSLSRFEAKL